jgi:hypothetical protein
MQIEIGIDNREINFFLINKSTGKIKNSGDEVLAETWEDTYVDVNSLLVGKLPSICFNKFSRIKNSKKEPVWVDLNYKVTYLKEIESKKEKNV